MGLVLDQFRWVTQIELIFLSAVKPTTCPLDLCLSWLVKAIVGKVQTSLEGIINLSLIWGIFLEFLKEAVGKLLLKKTIDSSFLIWQPLTCFKCAVPRLNGQEQAFLEHTFPSGF